MPLQLLVSNALILIGAGFMLTSIIFSLKMLTKLPTLYRRRWALLTGFMVFFLLGYLGFVLISLAEIPLPIELVTGAVFLGGALFVLMVIGLTRQTVENILEKDSELRKINQELEQRVEARTRSLQEAITERDGLHREIDQVLNTISTGVRLINRDMTVRRVNKSFCAMTGRTEEELINSRCYSNFKGDSCRTSPDCAINRLLDSRGIIHIETTKTRMDGEQRHFMLTASPFLAEDGTVTGIVEDFQDITERVAMEQEREQMQTRLLQRSKLESVGQLAAGIAHEINTPIQYIGTNIDFFMESFTDITSLVEAVKALHAQQGRSEALDKLLEEADWDFLCEEVPSALAQTREGVDRVITIVRAMKEFSHPGSREKAPADLHEIINNTLVVSGNEWKYVAEVNTDFAEDLPRVPCLVEEMGQVLLNIIVNAAHAIADRGEHDDTVDKGTITIATALEERQAVIRISDTGVGMDDSVREKIFDPFFTTKEVGKGTGQGLSIARDVITNKHQGDIQVSSTPGKGTTFTIRLPLDAR